MYGILIKDQKLTIEILGITIYYFTILEYFFSCWEEFITIPMENSI